MLDGAVVIGQWGSPGNFTVRQSGEPKVHHRLVRKEMEATIRLQEKGCAMKPIVKGISEMKGVMSFGWRGAVEFVRHSGRSVLPVVTLLLFGGCASAPTASFVPYEVDQLEEPRLPIDHAFTIGVFKRVLANSHPMLELWRDMTFGRLLKTPQSWLVERERLGLAMSEIREEAFEEISVSSGFVFGDESIVPPPEVLLPYQIMAIDSKTSRALSVAAYDVSLYPVKSQVAILPIESYVHASNGLQAPSVLFERARSLLLRGDQVELGMRFCGIAFLLFVILTPVLCSLCAAHLSHPIRGSPPSGRIAATEPILTFGFLKYSS